MKKEYRSAIRSKRLIWEAFTKLLKEKDYSKITVTDIVKYADINRSTFYAHYPDVNGLLEELENEIINSTIAILEEQKIYNIFKEPELFFGAIRQTVEEKQELYKVLGRTKGGSRFADRLKEFFIQHIKESHDIPENIRKSPVFAMRLTFFMNGIIEVYQKWFSGELDCTLDEISEDLGRLIIISTNDVLEREGMKDLKIQEGDE